MGLRRARHYMGSLLVPSNAFTACSAKKTISALRLSHSRKTEQVYQYGGCYTSSIVMNGYRLDFRRLLLDGINTKQI
ncbi:hypothetical protein TVAG_238150 [Trichomonas vaginalis G3]|uniref:Uncharacterized protein n=1 Tax=Trichomonas vaginalis (strain ATCC PRA-98 / G3) TaxID=412133 RepID=A2DD15_TRIV3|nr:hypothetical protein TVAGG3_0578150 [Trichomonas vaginalis G3]EAY21789.1 hypothetical protein TVAG_238150 [Trichomonas vaginalis G3]KAI5522370.1 hypothetical protein TVAGG3_0578150 [Trichomonas vaginalis G3]|eukprot:XP_001582775.1 hypothetical protein [Trichomonas vaginalis G3]